MPAPQGKLDNDKLLELAERFGQEHEIVYGHRAGPEEPVELVNIAVMGRGIPETSRVPRRLKTEKLDSLKSVSRLAYFGEGHGWLDTSIITRSSLRNQFLAQPLLKNMMQPVLYRRVLARSWISLVIL